MTVWAGAGKEHAAARKGIFMRLRDQDLHKIVDAFTRQAEILKYSRLVTVAEIEANGFNLNPLRYIDTTEPEDLQDIDGHLRGAKSAPRSEMPRVLFGPETTRPVAPWEIEFEETTGTP